MRNLCLTYAREAYRGGVYPVILNASNEVAVESFIENKVKFTHIPEIIDCALTFNMIQQLIICELILNASTLKNKLAVKMVDIATSIFLCPITLIVLFRGRTFRRRYVQGSFLSIDLKKIV